MLMTPGVAAVTSAPAQAAPNPSVSGIGTPGDTTYTGVVPHTYGGGWSDTISTGSGQAVLTYPGGVTVTASADHVVAPNSGTSPPFDMYQAASVVPGAAWDGTGDYTNVYSDPSVATATGSGGTLVNSGAQGIAFSWTNFDTGSAGTADCGGDNFAPQFEGDVTHCPDLATLTFTFSQPVTDAVIHFMNIGGSKWVCAPCTATAGVWTGYTITSGQTLQPLSGGGNWSATDDTIGLGTAPLHNLTDLSPSQTAAGSVKVLGTYTSVTFSVDLYATMLNGTYVWGNTPTWLDYDTSAIERVAFQWTLNAVANPDSEIGAADTVIPGSLADVNNAGQSYSVVNPPANGTLALNADGTYTFTPDAGWGGTTSFDYEACLSATSTICASNTVTLTVTGGSPTPTPPPPPPPAPFVPYVVAVSDAYTTAWNTPLSGDAAALDWGSVDLAGATFTALTDPEHGIVTDWDTTTGRFVYTPEEDWSGSDSFRYQVCLRPPYENVCSQASELITVKGPQPTITAADDFYISSSDTVMTEGSARDGDSSPIPGGIAASVVTMTSEPTHGTVAWDPANNGTFTYTPNPGWTGEDSFTYQICLPTPNDAVCDSATEHITIEPPAPFVTAVDDRYEISWDKTLEGAAKTADSSAQGLKGATFEMTSQPSHGSVAGWNAANGKFVYTPVPGWSGEDSFTYQVCLAAPNESVCDTATEYITVKAPKPSSEPSAPDLSNDFGLDPTKTVHDFDPLAGFVPSKGAKAKPQSLTLARAKGDLWSDQIRVPGKGTFTVVDGKVRFVGDPGFSGRASIRYRVQDSSGQWATRELTVSAGRSNPSARPIRKDLGVWQMGHAYNVKAIRAFTPSQGSKTVRDSVVIAAVGSGKWSGAVSVPGKGDFTVRGDGSIRYTGPACYTGKVSILYRIHDSSGQWASSTVTVKVRGLSGKEICRV